MAMSMDMAAVAAVINCTLKTSNVRELRTALEYYIIIIAYSKDLGQQFIIKGVGNGRYCQ